MVRAHFVWRGPLKHVFGPVFSRRLGRSLGVDPVPFKTCNWNCTYCQLGRTSPLVRARGVYASCEDVLAQVREALEEHKEGVDWISFVGSGEPTLNVELGCMIRGIKEYATTPVAVVTNGALLFMPEVREDLLDADAVMPTVLAGSERLHKQIHRPAVGLGFADFVRGLVDFRREFGGQLWPEVLLFRDMNDGDEALQELVELLRRIEPDAVHLTLPARPPNESWVEPAEPERLDRAIELLGEVAPIMAADRSASPSEMSMKGEIAEAVLGVITRHPMTAAELSSALGMPEAEIQEALAVLERTWRARRVSRHGKQFWTCSDARYVQRRRHP
jgi:wyosine [tRNA(Phe)-imidazoG37] synthetase (radical SAM superfamily)